MSDKQPWYILAGGGAVIGLLLGLIIGSTGGSDQEDLEQRLADLEASVSEKIENAKTETAAAISGVSDNHTVLSDSLTEVKASVSDVNSYLSKVESSIGDRLSSLESQNAVLGEGQAAVGSQIAGIVDQLGTGLAVSADDLKAGFKSAMAEFHAERHGDSADSGTGGGDEAVAEPAAAEAGAPEQVNSVDMAAAKLADKIGPDGLVLTAGETGSIGDGKLYISRVSDEGVNAMIVGGDKVQISPYGGEVAVGGCEASLEGIVGRSAYFKLDCPS